MRSKILIALLLVGALCIELTVAGPIGGKADDESPSVVLTPYNATEVGVETVNKSNEELDVEKTQDSSSETSDESVTEAPIDSTTDDDWVDGATDDWIDSSVEDTTTAPITSSSEESSAEETSSETSSEGTSSETSEGTSEETSSEEKTDLTKEVEQLKELILYLNVLVQTVEQKMELQDMHFNQFAISVQQVVQVLVDQIIGLHNAVFPPPNRRQPEFDIRTQPGFEDWIL